jgi:methionyl-tRNA formyltransferase
MMLCSYKGPAPLYWTIINGDRRTGMSLQTLHPTSFDEGVILAQTPWPGIDIPEGCDYPTLLERMKPHGAEMLVNAIRNRLYVPPLRAVAGVENLEHNERTKRRGPKVQTADRQLCFETMNSSNILGRSRAFESTWAYAAVRSQSSGFQRQRVLFPGRFELVRDLVEHSEESPAPALEIAPGLPYWSLGNSTNLRCLDEDPMLVNTIDGKTLSAALMKVEGGIQMPAFKASVKHKLIGTPRKLGSKTIITFHEALSAK